MTDGNCEHAAEAHNLADEVDRVRERLWRLAALAGWRAGNPADNDATAELYVTEALMADLRSRLACVLEASYWDRPYDDRIAAIRGMCDLTTNGLTAAADGEQTIRDVLIELDNTHETHGPEYFWAIADAANRLSIDLGRHQ